MMRPILCWIALMLLGVGSADAITLEQVRQQINAGDVQHARFEQTRQVSGLTKPLVSSGELLLARGQGLWWHQLKPFELTLTLTPSRMVQQMPGQPAQVLDNPQLLEFSHLMLALFAPTEASLGHYFTHQLVSQGQSAWTLTLLPKQAPLDKVFAKLELSGEQGFRALAIYDKQGDVTRLQFTDWQVHPLPLSAEEQARFVHE